MVKLTKKKIREMASDRGGFGRAQLDVLGISWPPPKGWQRGLVGRLISGALFDRVKGLRNVHLLNSSGVMEKKRKKRGKKRRPPAKKGPKLHFIDPGREIPWAEQYLHPNWQKMRLLVLRRDNFTCVRCDDQHSQLHVHHLKYSSGYIWEVPMKNLETLCKECHDKEHLP